MVKQKIITQIRGIILTHANPERIYLYGSQVNGEAGDRSDIDIAFDDPDFKDYHKIEKDIENIDTLLKIDIKNLAKCDTRFTNRVKSTGKILYSATKKLRAEDGLYNFSNALKRYVSAIENQKNLYDEGFGDMYLDLIVKRFEFTYETGWKAIKRVLDYMGLETRNPRACIKEAYVQNLIDNEAVWLDMIEQRNLSSHVYDEYQIEEIKEKTELYKKAFQSLQDELLRALSE